MRSNLNYSSESSDIGPSCWVFCWQILDFWKILREKFYCQRFAQKPLERVKRIVWLTNNFFEIRGGSGGNKFSFVHLRFEMFSWFFFPQLNNYNESPWTRKFFRAMKKSEKGIWSWKKFGVSYLCLIFSFEREKFHRLPKASSNSHLKFQTQIQIEEKWVSCFYFTQKMIISIWGHEFFQRRKLSLKYWIIL